MNSKDVKALALANGFKLKEQPSGEMGLNPYVYEFASALEQQVLQNARNVFGQDAVTGLDIDCMNTAIDEISKHLSIQHSLVSAEEEQLELLVTRAMQLGELNERMKWQQAQAEVLEKGVCA